MNAIKAMSPYVSGNDVTNVVSSTGHGRSQGVDVLASCKDMMEEMKAIIQS